MQSQIRRRYTRRLISVYTFCIKFMAITMKMIKMYVLYTPNVTNEPTQFTKIEESYRDNGVIISKSGLAVRKHVNSYYCLHPR